MCLTFNAYATAWQSVKFTEDQKRLLEIAREEGEKIGYPETIQAILLQETTAGLTGPVGDIGNGFGKRSYCHMQIKVASAQDVIRKFDLPRFKTEEELIARLITDDHFCIQMGARYFKLMLDQTKNWNIAVLAYNRGAKGAKRYTGKNGYVKDIRSFIVNVIRPYENNKEENKVSSPVLVIDDCSPRNMFDFFTSF